MSTPPYVLAAITTVGAGYMSDRLQRRGIVAMLFATIGALGFIMLTVTNIPGVNYTGMFFAAAGVYPLIPVVVSWGSNNCGGSLKKGVATAIIVSVGNAGGVISSFIYPAKDKPRYYKGHGINIGYCVFVIFSAAFMTWYLNNQNKKKDAKNAARSHPWTDAEKIEHEDRGDAVDWFKYTI
jgi:MFS family permease